jgi:hypothetical protein
MPGRRSGILDSRMGQKPFLSTKPHFVEYRAVVDGVGA